tara:strand:+ start:127 stop:405 length:279 start_codon:yes stop_codon:yes gene_type:complete
MTKILLIGCVLMGMVSTEVIMCPDTILIEKNKIWSERWCEALIIRNKVLKEKYGPKWYTQEIYKTIPKNERETELLKQLRRDSSNDYKRISR